MMDTVGGCQASCLMMFCTELEITCRSFVQNAGSVGAVAKLAADRSHDVMVITMHALNGLPRIKHTRGFAYLAQRSSFR